MLRRRVYLLCTQLGCRLLCLENILLGTQSVSCQLDRQRVQIDMDCVTKVTYIGPREEWRVKTESYWSLYELLVDSMYSWLTLRTPETTIDNLVDIVCSVEATIIDDTVISERFGADAVLKPVDGLDSSITNAAVDATIDMIQPFNLKLYQYSEEPLQNEVKIAK
ncbi:hypothetical protein PHMEG_0008729 [Phytophthora megakarya]|uniref:Uncharacterized protein n=1 Tax=Phytophthora megakarya TaxID=4795 RepID=A0A225WK12_9STRA|nr:hypothetical protein PHMEG_0008729 [Phytophthora megakarya]